MSFFEDCEIDIFGFDPAIHGFECINVSENGAHNGKHGFRQRLSLYHKLRQSIVQIRLLFHARNQLKIARFIEVTVTHRKLSDLGQPSYGRHQINAARLKPLIYNSEFDQMFKAAFQFPPTYHSCSAKLGCGHWKTAPIRT